MSLKKLSLLEKEPQPWSRELIEKAYFEDFTRAPEVIDETAGGQFWLSLNDLQDTIWIFQQSATELFDEISVFADRSRDLAFWQQVNSIQADSHTKAVKKCIFNCTASLMALVDHARSFQEKYPIDGYSDKAREVFPSDGLHSFLQKFRNYNTHWRVAEANWSISHNFENRAREVQFVITKKELLRWNGWNASAKEYIAKSSDPVDVRHIFSEYRKCVHRFYSWHWGEVLSRYAETYQPYLYYKRVLGGIRKKLLWNMLLTRAPRDANPYAYIGKYLPKEQIEKLLALQSRSEAQADALIEMLDMQEFCSPELKAKAISIFQGSQSCPTPTSDC
ncbi:hypothetical protein [Xanthomonas vasicola]|uniref:hypothetical protein n=1 Tax=Xanthomonas vasicola TaxID=56459 RepID=UPI000361DF17|nr:hypothetical protein [Xanthomonas vasicola]AZR28575.1 hypothetical protein NX80_021320 [Xanthomonas vasicola pv. arecae]KFA37636.1 hypothetical protein KWI_0104150 [Xanthomonas vasicola pv. vasculorum NCPPB 206]MDO6950782.1 hypothetical protein [Xanthomonas vasicola]